METYERDRRAWDWHILCQGKVTAGANDMRVSKWAIPNVKAIWNARRNRLGKGLFTGSKLVITTSQLIYHVLNQAQ